MKIQKIYDKYKIMPQLQLHMLRVAAVASIICDNFEEKVDKKSMISACLLHDMGNIIKFKLDLFPENLEERGLEYWQKVQNDFRKKYGDDEHIATHKICKEIKVNKKVYKLVEAFGFSKGKQTLKTNDYEIKISSYSDHRVEPFGIVSLRQRHDKAIKRKKKLPIKFDLESKEIDILRKYWQGVEKQIFAKCKIKPSEITNKNVNPLLEDLRNFEIPTN